MKSKTLKSAAGALRKACKFCIAHTGLNMVYVGILLFAVLYLTGTTDNNALLYLPLLIILAGAVGFVRQRKSEERY